MLARIRRKLLRLLSFADRHSELQRAALEAQLAEYLRVNLRENPAYLTGGKLNLHEFKVYSQGGEDGILEEIFARIGAGGRTFVEFGVEDGQECNSLYLLLKGWSGLWLEGDGRRVALIQSSFPDLVERRQLQVRHTFVTPENIDTVFAAAGVAKDLDLLSIDIDGNDYWVWDAVRAFTPRVVVIEYNATFPPNCDWTMAYDPGHVWDGTSHFGASLRALERLGERKGYVLVGCSFSGCNAFFVRRDLVHGQFSGPHTAEHFYEPPRYFLSLRKAGHPRRYGPGVTPDTGLS